MQGAVTKDVRLFNKNLTFCKAARPCIESDVCPVSVPKTWFQPGQGLVNGGSNYNSLKVVCTALVKSGYMLEHLEEAHYHTRQVCIKYVYKFGMVKM